MFVKICGVSNNIDAKNAINAGANAIGFVMGGKVLPVEVEPNAQTAKEIIKEFPKEVDSFIVTHLKNIDDILDLAEYVNSTGIQVSEYIGVENLKKLRKKTNKKIIKTIVVEQKENQKESLKKLKSYEPHCDFILLDTRFGGYTGGTGITNNWDLCKKLIKSTKKPVLIAGGLNPKNVIEAIKKSNPFGVDVSTGVSFYSDSYLRKDRKDKTKIKQFIRLSKKKLQ